MRGKVQHGTVRILRQRITPAYAGKSYIQKRFHPYVQDHPRLCGEKHWAMSRFDGERGSPPPMRGKADVVLNRIDRIGITPAYAGKSNFVTFL